MRRYLRQLAAGLSILLRTSPQPRQTNTGDCLETIAQLLPFLGPCCEANQESWSTFRAALILRTPGDPVFPTSTGLQGVNHTPSHQGPSTLHLTMRKSKVGAVNREMPAIRFPQKPTLGNALFL